VTAIIAESKQLQEFQELFEMYVSDYLVLTRCSEELLHLKGLWDMVSVRPPHQCTLLSQFVHTHHLRLGAVKASSVYVQHTLSVAALAGCRWAW
jgi:hypothetical protein